MLPPQRFLKLNPRHRARKLAADLAALEASYAGPSAAERGGLAALLRAWAEAPDGGLPPAAAGAAASCLEALSGGDSGDALRRALNGLRHSLLDWLGAPRAEWDLVLRDRQTAEGALAQEGRRAFPGTAAYLEDIRSPFNIGSILRSAECFGLERLLLSPGCADPHHPRAQRSGMGCDEAVGWSRLDAEEGLGLIRGNPGSFALETGGVPLDEFPFPEAGLCVVGSEELGVSPEALKACSLGSVSIPMRGSKASLNVGVAFGILMCAWAAALSKGNGNGSA